MKIKDFSNTHLVYIEKVNTNKIRLKMSFDKIFIKKINELFNNQSYDYMLSYF